MKLLLKLMQQGVAALEAYLAKRRREDYLKAYYVDLRCPHCQTMGSDYPGPPRIEPCGHAIAVRYTCDSCRKRSYWVCEAGFWFPSVAFGITPEQAEQGSRDEPT